MLMLIGSGWNKKHQILIEIFINNNQNKDHAIKLPFEKNISYS